MLRERASARGMASATYVALLTRSHLRGAAPIPKAEFLALRQSVNELTAMGRNSTRSPGRSTRVGRLCCRGEAHSMQCWRSLGRCVTTSGVC